MSNPTEEMQNSTKTILRIEGRINAVKARMSQKKKYREALAEDAECSSSLRSFKLQASIYQDIIDECDKLIKFTQSLEKENEKRISDHWDSVHGIT